MTEFQQRKKRKINSVDLILIVPWFSAIYNKKNKYNYEKYTDGQCKDVEMRP